MLAKVLNLAPPKASKKLGQKLMVARSKTQDSSNTRTERLEVGLPVFPPVLKMQHYKAKVGANILILNSFSG